MDEKQDKKLQGSVLKEEKEDDVKTPDYSVEEEEHIRALQKRLEGAKKARDGGHNEFDGLTYSQYYNANRDTANTAIKSKKNRGEVSYRSGTLRTKMMSFLSYALGLNLKGDISAIGKDEIPLNTLGNAMEDIVDKTEEIENGKPEEKKMLRQYELLVQGTVFLEDLWERRMERQKEVVEGFYGQIKGVKWNVKDVLGIGGPIRRIIPGKSTYLGDLKEYFIENQPYIFTVETMNRTKAEKIYGKWERWKDYVSQEKRMFLTDSSDDSGNDIWTFGDNVEKDEVEIIKYQDKPNHEYQIIINGVLMLPIGYPFPWGYNEYSIVQQNLEPIKHNFAYGKSFVFKNKDTIALLDEMMKLAVLKTQKSFMPPYLNLSGRVVNKSVFMPGKISRGIEQGSLVPVSDKEAQGVTNSEFNMIQEIMKQVDLNTASQTFTGSREQGGNTTATQIVELQKQARMMMGLTVLAFGLLEEKLIMKRLLILLKNWFSPIDTVLDEARKQLKNRYRAISLEKNIGEEGRGVRMTIMADELPSSNDLKSVEDTLKDKFDKPFRVVVLNPQEVQSTKLTWKVMVNPKQRESSEASKLMFRAEMTDAMEIGLQLDPAWIEKRFAEVWEENPDKMFVKKEEQIPVGAPMTGMQPPQGSPQGSPTPKIKAPQTVASGETPKGTLSK